MPYESNINYHDPLRIQKLGTLAMIIVNHFNVGHENFISKHRNQELVDARHIFYYLAKNVYRLGTLKEIGSFTGNRHHTTVLSGIYRVQDRIDVEINFEEEILLLRDIITKEMDRKENNERSGPGYIVATSQGKGRTYHSEPPVNGKIPVFLDNGGKLFIIPNKINLIGIAE